VRLSVFTKFLALIFLTLLLGGCSFSTPENSVKAFLEALRKGNFKKANTYLIDESGHKLSLFPESGETLQLKFFKLFYKRLSYQILSTEKENEQAITKIRISVPALSVILSQTLTEIFPQAFLGMIFGKQDFDKDLYKKFESKLSSPDCPFSENEIELRLKKVKGKWYIIGDKALFKILIGDLAENF